MGPADQRGDAQDLGEPVETHVWRIWGQFLNSTIRQFGNARAERRESVDMDTSTEMGVCMGTVVLYCIIFTQ